MWCIDLGIAQRGAEAITWPVVFRHLHPRRDLIPEQLPHKDLGLKGY
jgi:hypothetical protein